MFQGNNFIIKSGNEDGASKGIVRAARSWKESTGEEKLKLFHEEIDEDFKC